MISIIAAVSEDWGIGKDNELLWRLPDDLKRFKKLTMGNTLIMGKKTWESLPRKPLPGRKNIVLTDDIHECIDLSVTAYSIEDALGKCDKDDAIFVIGGGTVYRQFMPIADRLYITHVHNTTAADVYFPEIDPLIWRVIEKEEFEAKDEKDFSYTFIIYERRNLGKVMQL